jgi:hypothetical protein
VTQSVVAKIEGYMFIIQAIDFSNNFQQVYLAYDYTSYEFITQGTFVDTANQTQTMFTKNGIFVFSPIQRRIDQYTTNGTNLFTDSLGIRLVEFNAYIIEEAVGFNEFNSYFYYPGSEFPSIFNNERIYVLESTVEKGLAFATYTADRTSFTLHAYTEANGLVSSQPYNYEMITSNAGSNKNGLISYQTLEQDTSNTITHFIRYNNGWEFFYAYGDVINSTDALVMHNASSYVVDVATITDSNRDNALISVYNGLETSNDVLNIYLQGYDLLSVQIVGFAGDYMLANVYNNTAPRNPIGQGLLINLSTGTIVDLPESIWYLAPQLNESYSPNIYLTNNTITAFNGSGGFSFDVTNITNTFTTISDKLLLGTHAIWVNLIEDHFGENQDLIIVQESLNINPTNTSSLSVYYGDLTQGIDALTLITTVEIAENLRNSNSFIFSLDSIYVISMESNVISTLHGDVVSDFFYVQNGFYITYSDTYEETITLLEETDAIRI